MTQRTATIVQEALAVIGLGLFAFGLWQIYPPACSMFIGSALAVPFLRSLRGE